jgi:hypothetical protein
MTKKDMESHKIVALQMDWDELANVLINLEMERAELKDHMTASEIKKYDKLIEIYEEVKLKMVQELTIYVPMYY